VYKKSLRLFFMVVFVLLIMLIPSLAGAEGENVCRINEIDYTSLTEALDEAGDGDTITLLDNIDYTGSINIIGKTITFDLNGFTLNVTNTGGAVIEVGTGGEINLYGDGELNVIGSGNYAHGVYAHDGGKATITNATTSGYQGHGAYALNGGTIIIVGDTTASGAQPARGAQAEGEGSSIAVQGNVSSVNSQGVFAYEGGLITVEGNVSGRFHAIYSENATVIVGGNAVSAGNGTYAISGGTITLGGDAISTGSNGYGAYAVHSGSSITVAGNAISQGLAGKGVYAGYGAAVTIDGDAISEGTDGYGVYGGGADAPDAVIEIGGNISAENGTGARIWGDITVTVNGTITAEDYLNFDGQIKNIDDFEASTTKEGYFTYSDGTITVWVIYPMIWGIGIGSTNDYPFDGGDGTSMEEAYEISTANQLAQLAYNVNNGDSYTGKYFKLMNDIDLSEKEWVPIGVGYNKAFNGTFDGKGYTIEGLTITLPHSGNGYGLFGYVQENGVISNVNMGNGLITFNESPGSSKGFGGIAGYSDGFITNCTNKVDIILNYNDWSYAGGIVGMGNSDINSYNWSGSIDGCYNEGSITIGDRGSAGGIIGDQLNANQYTYFNNCGNSGEIIGGRSANIGGIAGHVANANYYGISNCYNTGNLITGSPSDRYGYIGGIVGDLYGGPVRNCYNTGNVTVLYDSSLNTSGIFAGGIIGYTNYSSVHNSYNTGTINGPDGRAGAFSGANVNYTSHDNCYYLENTLPSETSTSGGMSLSADQMKGLAVSEINYTDFNDSLATWGPNTGTFLYALNDGRPAGWNLLSWMSDVADVNGGYPILRNVEEAPYIISFDTGEGSAVAAQSVADGDNIAASPVSSQSGYSLTGWYTAPSDGSQISFPYTPNDDITLYARWSVELLDADKVSSDKDALIWDVISGRNITQDEVTADLELVTEGTEYGSIISWVSSDTDTVTVTGRVYRPSFDTGDKEVILTATITKNEVSDTKTFQVTVLKQPATDEEAVAQDTEDLVIGYASGDSANAVTQNLTFPTSGANGSTVTWTSDKTAIISNSGLVTRPSYESGDADVTVTASVYKNGISDSKEFTVTVLKLERSGGSSGGSSSSKPATPIETEEEISVYQITQEQNTTTGVEVTPTTSDSVSMAVVSTDVMDALIAKTLTEQAAAKNDTIEIKITAPESATVNVTIPQSSFEQVADDTNAGVQITAPIATIRFDERAVETINEAAKGSSSISISAGMVDIAKLSESDRAKVAGRPVYEFAVTAGDTKVTYFGGGKAMVNIPYTLKQGENPNSVVIYYLGDDGILKTVRGHFDSTTNTMKFRTTHFSKFVIGYSPISFNDVSGDAWYADAVQFIAAREITTGTGNGNYNPGDQLTRGQFLVMMMRAYDIEPDGNPTDNFVDAGNTYYTNYLAAAKFLEISDGIGSNKFAPNQSITRQEMFALLYNALNEIGELPEVASEKQLADFSDADRIAPWAKNPMEYFVKVEVLSGYDGKLAPIEVSTRAQMSQIMYNLLIK